MGKKKIIFNETDKTKLDLHGIKHADVDVLVEEFVLLNMPPVEIVTGHSLKMRSIVEAVLNRHDFTYVTPMWNAGVIIVIG